MRITSLNGWNGIKVLGGRGYGTSNDLIIAMHPFFEEQFPVTEKISECLINHPGPIMVLDDEVSQNYDQMLMRKNNPAAERYLITTEVCSNELKHMSYDVFCKFIGQFVNSQSVGLIGGYWDGNHEATIECGCLGSLDYELTQRGFSTNLLEGCVFGCPTRKQ